MRVLFIGTGEIGLPALLVLQGSAENELVGVLTQPDKPAGRAQQIQAPPIKGALEGSRIPILQPARIKDAAAIAEIEKLRPDVIVVMAYGQILPRAVLDIPRLACLNLHASLLPRWRGAAPIQAAIAAGDRETGITAMYMAEGLDTGDILLQRKLAIAPDETGGSLHDRLGQLAPEVLREALHQLGEGNAPRHPQTEALATSAPKLNREAGRIDWSEPAEVIERKIRAFDPWPGAFAILKGPKPRKMKIFSARILDDNGTPGAVLQGDEHGFVIATGRQSLLLREVQVEGALRLRAAELTRGYREKLEVEPR